MRAFVLLAICVVPVPGFAQPQRVDALGDPLPNRGIARLGTTRLMHYHWVQAVDFSKDGKTFASAGYGDGVWLWEWPSGKHIRTLQVPDEYIHFLRYTPDGSHIVCMSGYHKYALSVWDAKSGELVASGDLPTPKGYFPGLYAAGNDVVIAPESAKVALVFEIRTRKWLEPIKHDNPILAVGIDPDGKILVAEVVKGGVQVSSAKPGVLDRHIAIAKKPVAAGFGPGCAWAGVVDAEGTFTTVTLATGKQAYPPQKLPVKAFPIAFGSDGRRAVLGVAAYTTAVWDLNAGKSLHPLSKYVENLQGSAAFTPDGKYIASGFANAANAATFFDAATGQQVDLFPGHRVDISDFVFLSGGKEIATGAHRVHQDRILRVWDLASGKVTRRTEAHASGVTRIWSIDGAEKLVTQGFYGPDQFRIWESKTLSDKGVVFKGGFQPLAATVWPDLSRMAYAPTSGNKAALHILDVKAGTEAAIPIPGEYINRVELAGNADTLIVSASGKIHLVPVEKSTSFRTITGTPYHFIRVSADGRFFAFCEFNAKKNARLRLFETRTGKEVFAIGLPGATADVALSPIAPLIASDDGSGKVRVFDYTTKRQLLTFPAADGMLRRISFSPDGCYLATGGGLLHSGCVYVWDVADLKRVPPSIATQEQLAGWVRSLSDPKPDTAIPAAWELIDRPRGAIRAIAKALEEVKPSDPKRVSELIVKLGDEDFKTREKATQELILLGETARGPIEAAIRSAEAPEQRRRLEDVLRELNKHAASPTALFASRSAYVLERIGSKEAKELLMVAAKKGTILANEATAALARLGATDH